MATPNLLEQAKKNLGELFIIGFNGLEMEDDTAAFLSQARIGGVILFAQNYQSPAQVAELINQVQECKTDLPLWVSVDHEGGRVQRFKKGFTRIPDAALIGATGSPKLAYDIGEMIGKELHAVGVNVNYCPITDIATNPKNPVIGNRAYGTTEEVVTKIATGIMRGHLSAGVQPCVKHFPGHGDTSTDSHFILPRVDTSLEVLLEREFKPFIRAFKSHCKWVMTAHVLCPKLDAEFPATLSKKILQEILRGQMRYTGLIISDDLEMKAITDHFGAEEAPRLALEAGCDLLIYRTEAAGRHAYEALIQALDNGKLSPEIILAAAERSRALKKEVLLPYHPVEITKVSQVVGIVEHAALVEPITKQP